MKKRKICLVEPKHCHEEVILPQVELLRANYDVYVVAPQSLLNVDLLSQTSHLYHAQAFTTALAKNRARRILITPHNYLAILKIIKKIDPSVIIFNSTYSNPEVALIHCLFRNYKKIQIIHNFQQFLAPSARWLYRAFDGNLVISEQVHKYVISNHPEFADLEYFLPIFFDSFISGSTGRACTPETIHPLIRLGVFGSVEDDRRNYWGLFNAVKRLGLTPASAGFRIYLVGKASQKIQAYISEHNLQGFIKYYTEFVPFGEMFAMLAEMDIVLFLIDREVRGSEHYNRYKISGTSTLIKAFKKAGASSTDFPIDASLSDKCFYYQGTDIGSLLGWIANGTISAEDVYKKTVAYDDQTPFSFFQQQKELVSIIERVIRS